MTDLRMCVLRCTLDACRFIRVRELQHSKVIKSSVCWTSEVVVMCQNRNKKAR